MADTRWPQHLESWMEFLSKRLADPSIGKGDAYRLSRQLAVVEDVRQAAVLNPSLLLEFIDPFPVLATEKQNLVPIEGLNNAQLRAVGAALAEDRLLTLIQGPPGTGKTEVISHICHELWKRDGSVRVLVCSETHVAVDNLVERLAALAGGMRVIRVGSREGPDLVASHSTASIVWSFLAQAEEDLHDDIVGILRDELTRAFRLEINDRGDAIYRVDPSLEKALALTANVAGMTCNNVRRYQFRDSAEMFDVAIIDEACKATLPDVLAPLTVAKRAVILGDPKQLPPVFCSDDSDLIRRIEDCDLLSHMHVDEILSAPEHSIFLDEQYRMCNEIGSMVSAVFYNDRLRNGRDRSVGDSLVWVDYRPSRPWPLAESYVDGNAQIYNEDECDIICDFLDETGKGREVAVITPYRAQASRLREVTKGMESVEVGTIDSFQGKEADIVVFSVTRTFGSFRFLADDRRLNVALSRARDKIVIVGNLEYCERNERLREIARKWCRIERRQV